MTVTLTTGQLNKLSTLFLNIAQALFIISFAVSYFANGVDVIDAFKAFILGVIFTYLSLEAEKKREEVERR